FSMLIIVSAYLPLLTLTSIEGLLFRPMALTIVYALVGAVLFALFVVPALATWAYGRGFADWDNPVLAHAREIYADVISLLLKLRWLVVAGLIAVIVGVCLFIVPRLGTEFLPYFDEGVIWVRANFPEGTSLQTTAEYGQRLRQIALEFPDVDFIIAQA